MTPRTLFSAALLAAFAATPPAGAANLKCTEIGNVLHCSDGSRGTKIGNVYHHSDAGPAQTAEAEAEVPPSDAKCLRIADKEFCVYPAKARACRLLDGEPVCEPAR